MYSSDAHIWGSILMTSCFANIHYNNTNKKIILNSVGVGAAASLFIGVIGKEIIHDKLLKRGVYNNWDIADDSWGTLLGSLIIGCKLDFDKNGFTRWRDVKVHPVKNGKQYYFSSGLEY